MKTKFLNQESKNKKYCFYKYTIVNKTKIKKKNKCNVLYGDNDLELIIRERGKMKAP